MFSAFGRKVAKRAVTPARMLTATSRRTFLTRSSIHLTSPPSSDRHSRDRVGIIRRTATISQRHFAKTLYERMKEIVPEQQDRMRKILSEKGDKKISDVTVKQAFQGMRGVKGLLCETSELDPYEGITFRGLSVPQVQERLPKPSCRGLAGEYVLPEAMLWLLLTGEVPTDEEVRQLSEELTSEPRCLLPKHTRNFIDNLPATQHPMGQFAASVISLQAESKFARAYSDGVNRNLWWEYALDDSLDLIARIPQVTARIYRGSFRDGITPPTDPDLDWSANWCHMSGLSPKMYDLMRMYFTIHTDHEGGNVSAHATHLVGTALSDPYLSFAAGLCGLAGPLHGLANQESLRFIMKLKRKLGGKPVTEETIKAAVLETLDSGQVIPGFGHAVLKQTDPRYLIQRDYAKRFIRDDKYVDVVKMMYKVVPPILAEYKGGKIANPWPNLDAHSGVLLRHYGLREEDFYTVLFGMGRSIGVLSQYVIDRYMLVPLERPKSITLGWIESNVE